MLELFFLREYNKSSANSFGDGLRTGLFLPRSEGGRPTEGVGLYGGVPVSTGFSEVSVSTSRAPPAWLKSGKTLNANTDIAYAPQALAA